MERSSEIIDGIQFSIFHAQLSYDTVLQIFSPYGALFSLKLCKEGIMDQYTHGFVIYMDDAVVQSVLKYPPRYQGDSIYVSRSNARDVLKPASIHTLMQKRAITPMRYRSEKFFLGNVPHTCTESKLEKFFEKYGPLTDMVIMKDKTTGKKRGFGFITFEEIADADKLLNDAAEQWIDGRWLEVKIAAPEGIKKVTQ